MDPETPGGGHVDLSDSSGNVITGTVFDLKLTDVDNIISGAGHLGDGVMMLVNQGTIIASGINSLDIDTGLKPSLIPECLKRAVAAVWLLTATWIIPACYGPMVQISRCMAA